MKKSKIESIKKFWKAFRSEKGKRYSFLIFYFFFFLFIFFLIIPSKSDQEKPNNTINKQLEESSFPFLTSNLENNDYEFTYQIDCLNKIKYNGQKRSYQIIFEDTNSVYSYSFKNGELIEDLDINDVSYYEFSNIYFLKRVLKNSKLISETSFIEEEKYLYNYKIDSALLNTLIKEEITRDDSLITIKTNSLKQIEDIKIELASDSSCNLEIEIGDYDE